MNYELIIKRFMTGSSSQLKSLMVDETVYTTELTAKYRNRKAWLPPDNRKITAFLPGTITQVLVETGEQVKEGQTVLKFEAMKMINNVQATRAGKVKEINVQAGDKFAKGYVLVELE